MLIIAQNKLIPTEIMTADLALHCFNNKS